MRKENVPSLVSLCINAVKRELLRGSDDLFPDVFELPTELFNPLVECLPPLALQKLQSKTNANFNEAWNTLFNFRWHDFEECGCVQPVDWQQIYWETHVQDCLDEAAKIACLPSFSGCLGDILILESVQLYIGYMDDMGNSDCLKLSYQCQQFGCYVRCFTLQNVLCVLESCILADGILLQQLLRNSNLQRLVVQKISHFQFDVLRKLLYQNCRTLKSLQFEGCEISSSFMDAICGSFCMSGAETHQIQHFSISFSNFYEMDPVYLGDSLASFLSSGRSLQSLKLRDNYRDASSNIAGWLSNFNWRSGVAKSLQSLRILNLGGNNLQKEDAGQLKYALVQMPSLEILDLSGNPIGDEGIRSLIPYFAEVSKSGSPLTDLKLENCKLSSDGVTQLLDALSTSARPMNYLSLADNNARSQVAEALGKFWATSIKVLNLECMGLGKSGFQKLEDTITDNLNLVELNIRFGSMLDASVSLPFCNYFLNDKAVRMFMSLLCSKNNGGIKTAKFLSKLIVHAPRLVAVNASFNLVPKESLPLICSALKTAQDRLEKVYLDGNLWMYKPSHDAILVEFQHNGKPILVLPDKPDDDDND
ncbi:hypothetical protein V6N13_087340 [Hibiscus sabdariffa]